jgi:hypothetical protein
LHHIARISSAILLALVIALATAWTTLALWYRFPGPEVGRALTAGLATLLGLACAVAMFGRLRFRAIVLFTVAFGGVLIWWHSITPPADADWAPSVARQATGSLDGNILTLTNVRDFEWRSDSDFTERWTTRTYDLDKIRTLDLFMSYWAGPEIAHVILSFGFEGGDYLAWSIEVRRRKGGEFSPIADLFKSDPLVIVAADERDVVRVRSNVRGEDVQLYRLRTGPERARRLLVEYVADANALSKKPEFYNSLTTNCATSVVKIARAVGDKIPFDWRLIVDGYLPEYVYDHGALDTRLPFSELKALAHIDKRAQAAGWSPDFSRLIRVDVPSPLAGQTS